MQTKILNFVKTKHFMLRQWQRGCCDTFLYEILIKHNSNPCQGKINLIITSQFLKKLTHRKCHVPDELSKGNWIIPIVGNKLITIYYYNIYKINDFFHNHKNETIKIL